MKIQNLIFLSLLCLTIVAFMTSCTTERIVNAVYVMPPAKVKNVKDIEVLYIAPAKINLQGNINPNNRQIIADYLSKRIASEIYHHGFYKITDSLWGAGASYGIRKANDFLSQNLSPHGYTTFSAPSLKHAVLSSVVNIELNSQVKTEEKQKILKRIPFKVKRAKNTVYSVPDTGRISVTKQPYKVKIYYVKLHGNLKISLKDKYNKTIYTKTLPLKTVNFSSEEKPFVPFTLPELLEQAMADNIKKIIADISPHYVVRKLHVNNEGDEYAVKLLKAQAFSEAIQRLAEIIENKPTAANLENIGIALEVTGNYEDAKSYFSQALELQPDNQNVRDAIKRINTVIQGQRTLDKQDLKKKNTYETKDFKQR